MLAGFTAYSVREIRSARGRLVPIACNLFDVGGFIHEAYLGEKFFARWPWDYADTDCDVGEYAERLVAAACEELLLLFPVKLVRYDERPDQFKGKDFRCSVAFDLEVKSDIPGGVRGTGNLFVQTHEYRHQHGGRNSHLRLVHN